MALLPLNTFKTKTAALTTDTTATIYTAPVGVTTIVLLAQVANITTETQYVSFKHYRRLPILPDSQGNGGQPADTQTEIVNNFAIPPNDSATMTSGKLIIETLDSIRASATNENSCKIILSLLETANA